MSVHDAAVIASFIATISLLGVLVYGVVTARRLVMRALERVDFSIKEAQSARDEIAKAYRHAEESFESLMRALKHTDNVREQQWDLFRRLFNDHHAASAGLLGEIRDLLDSQKAKVLPIGPASVIPNPPAAPSPGPSVPTDALQGLYRQVQALGKARREQEAALADLEERARAARAVIEAAEKPRMTLEAAESAPKPAREGRTSAFDDILRRAGVSGEDE